MREWGAVTGGWLPRGVAFGVLCGALAIPTATAAQSDLEIVATRPGSARLHGLIGVTVGRFDIHHGPRLDVAGARAGIGFGELAQLTGFYWRGVDTGESELLDDRAWGGEAQLNLNAGFGVTPFLTAGIARLRIDTVADRTAATVGAGLQLPLGPLRLSVSAQDYVLGVSGLDDGDGAAETTHNWLFRAGATAVLGRLRGREPVVVARATPPATPAAVRADAPADPRTEPDERGVRNYQSDRRIEVPLPLEGSITLRYGPEPAAAPGLPTATGAIPATGEAAAVVAPPLAQRSTAPGLDEAAIGRVVERTVAALLPRLEARDAQRQNELRAELRAALTAQSELVRELVHQEMAAHRNGDPDLAETLRTERVAGTEAPGPLDAAIQEASARLQAARTELARIDAARAAGDPSEPGMATADIRLALADLSSRYPTMLTTAETQRGPAVVVNAIAFETGAVLPDDRVRRAAAELAAALRAAPDRMIFVHGHTDSVGSEVANQQLSELRAEVVRSFLVQAGIEPARVHAMGFGAGQPIATNATAAGRALNRRVEIVVGEAWNGGDR